MALEQFHERRQKVSHALSGLASVSALIGARTLSKRVTSEVIRKLEEGRFHLVVVGEFNHGKSSFVNALLGQPILPVGVTPTTAVIHHLEHAVEPYAKVVFNSPDKAAETLSFEELRTFAVGDKAAERAAEVQYIEVGYPSQLLKDRVVLVDTPGVNDLSLTRADITYKYIPRSDAVLFLLDAGQLIKESERVFLNEKLLAKSRDKIVFVVTKSDIWSESERKEAMAYVHRELAKLVTTPIVFAISSQAAQAGKTEEGGIEPLVAHLSKFLAEERGRIVLDHALAEGLAIASLLAQGIDAKRHALRMTKEDLDRRIAVVGREAEGQLSTIDARRAHIREEVSAIKAWSRRDLDTFCEDVIRQIPAIVDKATGSDLKQHLSAFLEKSFREWAQAESNEIAIALEQLAERTVALVKEDARESAKKLGDALNITPPAIDVDTFAYDVGIAALFTIGVTAMFANFLVGGMLTLAAPLLAYYVQGKVETETKKRAKELAPLALREAAAKVGPKMEEMIGGFAKELDAWVVSTGKDMYREMLEVLSAAREEKKERAGDEAATNALLDEQEKKLVAVNAGLEKLRETLWVDGVEGAEIVDGSSNAAASTNGVAGT